MAAFTTWTDLYKAMLDDLASGAWRRTQSYGVAGQTVSYRSFTDFMALLKDVEQRANVESGSLPYVGRTFGGQGGRG